MDKQNRLIEDVPTVDLLTEIRRRFKCLQQPPMRLVMIGPPGCGKGTQSQEIKYDNCLCHISTGDILRERAKVEDEEGRRIKNLIDEGKFVDVKTIMSLVEERLLSAQCRRGFIMDGIPRNVEQAEMVDQMLERNNMKLDTVVSMDMPQEALVKRVCGRRVHPSTGRVYHTEFKTPKVADKDDFTGEPLVQRRDDTEEVLRSRLQTYDNETKPVLEFYRKAGLLQVVDASLPEKEVKSELYQILQKRCISSQSADVDI